MKVHWSLPGVKGIFPSLQQLALVIAVIIISYDNLFLSNLVAGISGERDGQQPQLYRFKQDLVRDILDISDLKQKIMTYLYHS